uniref:Uncharacterized protein n=1 Tax=Anguilla anguilla TaxID=7936 RepID=A0A0E9Q0B9_ANGAN
MKPAVHSKAVWKHGILCFRYLRIGNFKRCFPCSRHLHAIVACFRSAASSALCKARRTPEPMTSDNRSGA